MHPLIRFCQNLVRSYKITIRSCPGYSLCTNTRTIETDEDMSFSESCQRGVFFINKIWEQLFPTRLGFRNAFWLVSQFYESDNLYINTKFRTWERTLCQMSLLHQMISFWEIRVQFSDEFSALAALSVNLDFSGLSSLVQNKNNEATDHEFFVYLGMPDIS